MINVHHLLHRRVIRFWYACQHINFVGVMEQGAWKLIDQLEDPELRGLASRLPQTILHSCADSTVKKYLGTFRRWKSWAVQHKSCKASWVFLVPAAHWWPYTLEGLKHLLAKPVVKKELMTVEMLEAIVDDAERSGSFVRSEASYGMPTWFLWVYVCCRNAGA